MVLHSLVCHSLNIMPFFILVCHRKAAVIILTPGSDLGHAMYVLRNEEDTNLPNWVASDYPHTPWFPR